MTDAEDDEPEDDDDLTEDDDYLEIEQKLFAAIRWAHQLDAEIDEELQQLSAGEYKAPSVLEPRANDGGAS